MSKDSTPMSLEMVFNRPHDAVNLDGTKWWIDKDTTAYARKPDSKGIKLDVAAWYVETLDGHRAYLLTGAGKIIFESQQLEGIGAHIDIMKMQKLAKQSELDKDDQESP